MTLPQLKWSGLALGIGETVIPMLLLIVWAEKNSVGRKNIFDYIYTLSPHVHCLF